MAAPPAVNPGTATGMATATGGSGGFRGATEEEKNAAMKEHLRSCILAAPAPKVDMPSLQADMARLADVVEIGPCEEEGLPMSTDELARMLPTAAGSKPTPPQATTARAKPPRRPKKATPPKQVRFSKLGGEGGGGGDKTTGAGEPTVVDIRPDPACVQCVRACGESCVQPCLQALCVCCPCGPDGDGDCRCSCSKCSGECITDALYIENRTCRLIVMAVLAILAFFCIVFMAALKPVLLLGALAYSIPCYLACRCRMFIPVHSAAAAFIGTDVDSDAWDCSLAVVYIVFVIWIITAGVVPAVFGGVALLPGVLYAVVHVLLVFVGILQLVGVVGDA